MGAGELSVIRWHALTQGAAKLEMPTGRFYITPGKCGPATTKFSPSPESMSIMNQPVLSAASSAATFGALFFNVFAGNAVLAPVNHSVELTG